MRMHFRLSSLMLAAAISVSTAPAQQASKEPGPTVTLEPTGLAFGNQPVGIRSAVQTVTLTNSGNLPLTIERVYLSSTDYSQTHDCPASLPAGASCTLSVTFLPTGVGTRASVVRIDDNAPGSPHRLGLTGAGTPSETERHARETAEAEARPERNVDAPTPDTRPLSGAEEISPGLSHGARNYVLPSIQLNVYGDTNQATAAGGTSDMEIRGSAVVRIALKHVTRKSQLGLDYMGGGLFYSRDPDLNSTIHQFGITQSIHGRRWGLMLSDRASYLPESPFGFSGFGGLGGFSPGLGGSFGSTLGNLNPAYTPNQSIFSGGGDRVSNTTVVQLEYTASARSGFTASGSYGILRFGEAGLIESDQRVYTVGYNYMATRKDTVALSYGYSQFRFKGVSLGFDNHFANLSYGRRITGRAAFELSGGPQVMIFRNSATSSNRSYSWNAHTALHYRVSRADLGLSYSHFTSGGSGVLFGAQTDQLQGSLGFRMTRRWSALVGPGYSRNTRLRQTTAGNVSVNYDNVYAGVGLRRALGQYMDVSFNYNLQDQRLSVTGAPGTLSGTSYLRHMFGFGLSWHTREIEID